MGLILDTSVLIADERGRFDMPGFLRRAAAGETVIAAITASELLHGVERATDMSRKARRHQHVEQLLSLLAVVPFGLAEARCHARLWADLASRGMMIGPHDLQIAATARTLGYGLATINVPEFERVTGLQVVDGRPFLKEQESR